MRPENKREFTLFLIAVVVGFISYQMQLSNYYVIVLIMVALGILLLNVPIDDNIGTYKKILFILGGVILGRCIDSGVLSDIDQLVCKFIVIIIIIALLLVIYGVYHIREKILKKKDILLKNRRDKESWEQRNIFIERKQDLERIKHSLYSEKIDSLGIEAEWGAGKTFIVEGIREQLEQKNYLFVMIDVMAIRLDDYPEYLVRELDDILYQQGVLSKISKRLERLLQNSKLNIISSLWNGVESQYAKLFEALQEELLCLNKHIVLIYEDIDRVDDVQGIKNILYLSEKLTSKNDQWENSSIQIIYQYSLNHLESLGLDSQYLEKYIQHRQSLTKLSLCSMIQAFQSKCSSLEQDFLTEDDIYRLPPYIYVKKTGALFNEHNLIKNYFSKNITVRKVKNFLYELKMRIYGYPSNLQEQERNVIIAFCFIEHFMPNVYEIMNAMPLYTAFDIVEECNRRTSMSELVLDEIGRNKLLNAEKYPHNFELYIAWRLLGIDAIKRIEPRDYQGDNTEIAEYYGRSMGEVAEQEALLYLDIEKIIHYLYEAGKVPVNDYINTAMKMVEKVFSEKDESKRDECFKEWLNEMKSDTGGTRTIMRLGVNFWYTLFQAFYFASPKWTVLQKKENYENLILFYKNKQVLKNTFFSQQIIEDLLPLWEGISDRDTCILAFEMVQSLKVRNNWNEYDNFYRFVGRSLYSLYKSGFFMSEYWLIEELFANTSEKKKKAINIIKRIENKVDCCINVLNANPGYLEKELKQCQSIKSYLNFIKTVMSEEKSSKIRENSLGKISIKDESLEAMESLEEMKNDNEFKMAINKNENGLTIEQLVDIIRRRKKKYEND